MFITSIHQGNLSRLNSIPSFLPLKFHSLISHKLLCAAVYFILQYITINYSNSLIYKNQLCFLRVLYLFHVFAPINHKSQKLQPHYFIAYTKSQISDFPTNYANHIHINIPFSMSNNHIKCHQDHVFLSPLQLHT